MTTRAYLRVSTAEQVRDGHSLGQQQAELQRYAMARGWTIDRTYTDQGVSSGKRRPELDQAIADMRAGDTLIVTRLDRICRSTVEYCGHAEQAERGRWDIVLLDQPHLDMSTPGGRLMARTLASFAEFERDMIRQRTREGMRGAAAAGRIALVPDDVRQRIVEMADDDGLSQRKIAEQLTAAGVPTPNGAATWARTTVQRVLAAPSR
jgi:DNA invertase Pin-like site-specific DNA recombinase